MHKDLIFDFGMYDGTDTDFYLRKGFRVVAVEADPDVAAAGAARFADEIAEKRLVIVNKAIARERGPVTLFRSANSLWSTINTERNEQTTRKGTASQEVTVDAVTSKDIVEEFGTPYYCKIDIEGLDLVALNGFVGLSDLPKFISIESKRHDMANIREELSALVKLGYDHFKVIAQHKVKDQKEPSPPREGKSAGNPVHESSGLFGEDLPGPWLTYDQAVDAYRRPLLNHYLTGGDALITNRWLRAALKRTGFHAGWYDTHARLAGS